MGAINTTDFNQYGKPETTQEVTENNKEEKKED